MASTVIPVTNQLFGDDVKATFASIASSSRSGMVFTQSSKGTKFFTNRGMSKNGESQWDERRRGRNPRRDEKQT